MPPTDIPIEKLIEQLHGSDWMARCDAARLLGQSRDPRAVDALLPDLADPDWRVRRNAAQALGALRDPRAVEPLIRSLKDRTATVRERSLVALGRIKDPRALPALLDVLLHDKHAEHTAYQSIRKFGKKALPAVLEACKDNASLRLVTLLAEMKYERVADLLIKLLDSPESSTRWMAIQELGRLGDKRVTNQLLQRLNDSEETTQSELVRALGKLGATEAIPAILDLLKDNELYGPHSGLYHSVTEAFQNLSGVTKVIEEAFPGKYPPMFGMANASFSLPEMTGLMGGDPFQVLRNMLNTNDDRLEEAAERADLPADLIKKAVDATMWKFGVMFADARDANQERTKRLIELLGSASSLERAAAALSLPWYSDEKSVEPLLHASMDSDETVRRAAGWAVEALKTVLRYRSQFGQ